LDSFISWVVENEGACRVDNLCFFSTWLPVHWAQESTRQNLCANAVTIRAHDSLQKWKITLWKLPEHARKEQSHLCKKQERQKNYYTQGRNAKQLN
jgi:hypothetical protein